MAVETFLCLACKAEMHSQDNFCQECGWARSGEISQPLRSPLLQKPQAIASGPCRLPVLLPINSSIGLLLMAFVLGVLIWGSETVISKQKHDRVSASSPARHTSAGYGALNSPSQANLLMGRSHPPSEQTPSRSALSTKQNQPSLSTKFSSSLISRAENPAARRRQPEAQQTTTKHQDAPYPESDSANGKRNQNEIEPRSTADGALLPEPVIDQDISRYEKLLAEYFANPERAKAGEPPSLQEWLKQGKPSF